MGSGDPGTAPANNLSARLRRTVGGDPGPEDQLAGMLVDDLAASRGRTRWMSQRDVEAASFTGTLLDLAERGVTVSVRTSTGRVLQGSIRSLGEDHLAILGTIAGTARPRTLVALHAVVAVTVSDERNGTARGDRPVLGERFVEVLTWWAAERPRVTIGIPGVAELVTGTLWSCGTDVCTVRDDSTNGRWSHLPIGRMAEVTFVDS